MEIFGIHNQLTSACCSPPVPDAEHSCPVWHGMLREVSPPQGNYLDAFHPRKSSLLIPGGQLTLSPRSTELTSQWHVCCDQRQTHFRWILRRVVSSWHCTGRYFCDSQHLWWLGQVPVGLCNGGGDGGTMNDQGSLSFRTSTDPERGFQGKLYDRSIYYK